MSPIIGFAPDADPTTVGVLTACASFIPFESGFKAAASPVAVAVAALAAPCRGSVVATRLGGTRRIFAGTQQRLYELAGSGWLDRSKAGAYTGSTESRWSFCQFGDTSMASNLVDPMQQSTAGAFADVPTAPKAKIIVSASNNFVLAFNTNDATYGVSPDRWWNCAQSDQTNWTPVQGGPTTGRLVAVEGPIQAGLPLGDYVVAYKSRGVFLGSFVGGDAQWQWTLITGADVGAVGQEAVCDIGGAHFFVSEGDFWLFDGTRPVSIGEGVVRRYFSDNSNPVYRFMTQCTYDKLNGLVRVNFPSKTSNGVLDRTLVYHVKRQRWGVDDHVVQAPLNYIVPGVTINGLDTIAATIDTLPNVPVDSQFWMGGGQVPAYFNSSNQLVSLSGIAGASSFTSNDFGDDDAVTMIDRFRTRFSKSPATAQATGFIKMNEGDPLVQGSSSGIFDGKFDLRQSGRFHRVRVDMTGDVQATAFDARAIPVGER
ncbi:hypothetical protein ABIC33_001264 [Variovorax sp. 1140]|uniref:hypothetical protein n=1 Tax=Variovorax atrisoli TaxID=3394203 RepID=UPI003397AD55